MIFVSFDELIVLNAIVNCHYSNNYSTYNNYSNNSSALDK